MRDALGNGTSVAAQTACDPVLFMLTVADSCEGIHIARGRLIIILAPLEVGRRHPGIVMTSKATH